MVIREPDDEIEEALSALRVHDASPERIERTRARCLSVLAPRRGSESWASGPAGWRGWLEPAFAFGLATLYLAESVVRALAVYR